MRDNVIDAGLGCEMNLSLVVRVIQDWKPRSLQKMALGDSAKRVKKTSNLVRGDAKRRGLTREDFLIFCACVLLRISFQRAAVNSRSNSLEAPAFE